MAQGYDTDQAFPRLGARTDTKTLFGPTMGLVAVTAALFTLGAYLARNLSGGWGVGFWMASLGCLLAMNLTVRQSEQLTLGLLFGASSSRSRPARSSMRCSDWRSSPVW